MKVLVMGLPNSGKSTIARELSYHFLVPHYNADTLREKCNDWDFSYEGRMRQSYRMSFYDFGIMDFISPLYETRRIIDADFTIWMDTVENSIYEDTNNLFEPPDKYDIRVTQHIPLNFLRTNLGMYQQGIEGLREYLYDARRNDSLLVTKTRD